MAYLYTGHPVRTVPNDLSWLEGMVTPCGALAPEAVEDTDDDCARGLGMVKAPNDCEFCPG